MPRLPGAWVRRASSRLTRLSRRSASGRPWQSLRRAQIEMIAFVILVLELGIFVAFIVRQRRAALFEARHFEQAAKPEQGGREIGDPARQGHEAQAGGEEGQWQAGGQQEQRQHADPATAP